MSVHLKCDRCGVQEQTSGVMVLARVIGPGLPSMRPELPDGWTRPQLPNKDGELRDREMCPQCKADLFRFMAGQPVIDDAELASRVMGVAFPAGRSEAEALRLSEKNGACTNCGATPDRWCETCASCPTGCHGGHKDTEPCPEEAKTDG